MLFQEQDRIEEEFFQENCSSDGIYGLIILSYL